MASWEYTHTAEVSEDDFEAVLDALGKDGWELAASHRFVVDVSSSLSRTRDEVVFYAFTMKRPLVAEKKKKR